MSMRHTDHEGITWESRVPTQVIAGRAATEQVVTIDLGLCEHPDTYNFDVVEPEIE